MKNTWGSETKFGATFGVLRITDGIFFVDSNASKVSKHLAFERNDINGACCRLIYFRTSNSFWTIKFHKFF